MIPDLTNYVANAYNTKDGNFLSQPVFKLTYEDGQTINWGQDDPQEEPIPDQIKASTTTTHYELSSSLLLQSKADYDRSFSVSVDAEYSGVTFSGSVQSSLLYHGSLFSDTSSSYALNFYLQSVLNFERLSISSSSLEDDFITAVKSLPTTITTVEDQEEYFKFFDNYGTHYTSFATMGGTIVMETQIDDSVFQSYSSVEVTAGVSAGYNSVISNGTLDASAAYSSSTNKFLSETSSKVTLNVMGGFYSPDESISDWATSIYNTPSILLTVPTQTGSSKLTTLTAISNLVQYAVTDTTEASTIAGNMITLLHSYMMQDTYADSLLTSPQDINFSQAYQASQGDGFVISTVQGTISQMRGYVEAFDNTTPNPITMRATASQHFDSSNNTWIRYASLTMPTPANTYYTSNFTSTLSSSASLKLVGLGNIGEEGMGDWQELSFNKDNIIEETAENDGFVVAYVDWNNINTARGYVIGSQQLPADSSNYTDIAGASQHQDSGRNTYVPTNSFCMPIAKDTNYKVQFATTSSQSKFSIAKVYFVPLSEELVLFEELQDRTEDRVYQAQSDGFLVAYIHVEDDKDRGDVQLYSYPDLNDLIKLGNIASTSIHLDKEHGTYVQYNSAMIPVPKYNYYKAVFTAVNNPVIKLSWIPLGIQSEA